MSKDIESALKLIFDGIDILKLAYCNEENGNKHFTIDGKLVGDLGEVIAGHEFEIKLDGKSRHHYDAITRCNRKRNVQIKATFKKALTFRDASEESLYIGLKLFRDGSHEVIFNGPGRIIKEYLKSRKGCGEKLLSVSIKRLKDLNRDERITDAERVALRRSRLI